MSTPFPSAPMASPVVTAHPAAEAQAMSDAVIAYLAQERDAILGRLKALLRIPSVSTDPAYAAQMQQAREFLLARLRDAGLTDAQLLDGGGQPAVYASWMGAPGKPTLIIYGHYDVQPADPLELWRTAPFEPTEIDGRLYARGASDVKGSTTIAIETVSVTTVSRTPSGRSASSSFRSNGVACRNIRADKSPAMMLRACSRSACWNDWLNPRTPVSAATPTATDRSTNRNFVFPARSSRHAIFPAVAHGRACLRPITEESAVLLIDPLTGRFLTPLPGRLILASVHPPQRFRPSAQSDGPPAPQSADRVSPAPAWSATPSAARPTAQEHAAR